MKGSRLQARPAQAAEAPAGARRLKIGESVSMDVPARELWHNTQVLAAEGEQYLFNTSGKWTDFYIPCDAAGYPSVIRVKPLEAMRRLPEANWFALVGCLGRSLEHAFLIGRQAQVEMPADGIIHCFANDLPWAYWNNWGEVTLKITRIK